MRRKEREVTDLNRILQVLGECKVCRLALSDENAPYVVPLSFGYELSGGSLTLYFHCAANGKKTDLIKKCPNAGFETDNFRELVTAEKACGYSAKYSSVIGWGNVKTVDDNSEKLKGLLLIMRHYTGKSDFSIPNTSLGSVCVVKLIAKEFTCKENL